MGDHPRCDKCRFWIPVRESEPDGDDALGHCHRHAPSPTKGQFEVELLNHMTYLSWHFASDDYAKKEFQQEEAVFAASFWPATWGDKWCGEFEHREAAD
jgi:hypothetical protein